MKIKDGFMLRKVGGQNVVVAVGKASRDFNGIIRLNDTGRFLWEKQRSSPNTTLTKRVRGRISRSSSPS